MKAFDNIHSFDDIIGRYKWYNEAEGDTYLDLREYGGGKIILDEFSETISASDFIFANDAMVA